MAKRILLIAILAVASAALPPRCGAETRTIHRSFRGGYPTWVSDARRESVSAGPTGASLSSSKKKTKTPHKLVGKAKCVEDSVTWVTVVTSDGEYPVLLDKLTAFEFPAVEIMLVQCEIRAVDDIIGLFMLQQHAHHRRLRNVSLCLSEYALRSVLFQNVLHKSGSVKVSDIRDT